MMRSVVVSMCTSAFCISARSVRYTPTPMNVQDRIVWATAFARWPDGPTVIKTNSKQSLRCGTETLFTREFRAPIAATMIDA